MAMEQDQPIMAGGARASQLQRTPNSPLSSPNSVLIPSPNPTTPLTRTPQLNLTIPQDRNINDVNSQPIVINQVSGTKQTEDEDRRYWEEEEDEGYWGEMEEEEEDLEEAYRSVL